MATDYELKAGDVLRIEVIEDSSLNRNVLILPDGMIAFPMVGQVQAAGRTVPQIREAMTKGLAPNFAVRPTLHVAVANLAQPKPRATAGSAPVKSAPVNTVAVFGMGELGKPGKLDIAPGTSLLQFVAQAGGVTPYAATKRVQVRRLDASGGAEAVYRINLKRLMRGAGGKNFLLQDGDVVIVPERKLFE